MTSLCAATPVGDAHDDRSSEGVPYAVLVLDHACSAPGDGARGDERRCSATPRATSRGTKTIVTYELDGGAAARPSTPRSRPFSTEQSTGERFWEFFHLGAEHLLTGIDHILFLLALIAGSRRLREVVLAATAFTLAHSVTFILASTGVISAPARRRRTDHRAVDRGRGLLAPLAALAVAATPPTTLDAKQRPPRPRPRRLAAARHRVLLRARARARLRERAGHRRGRGRGRCCGRCSSSTSGSRSCSSRSSPRSSRC